MKWEYKCNLKWLKERQQHLTATDVKELVPYTKTGRSKKIEDEDYVKVLSRKFVNLTEDDCVSYGAAARGHILEPFALEVYNGNPRSTFLYHWDDTVICKDERDMGLSFSPDATNVPEGNSSPITVIGEVKSYGAEKHFACGLSDKMDLEERWQLATAMAVLPSIEKALLLFFNPSTPFKLFVKEYTRAELVDEIKIINEVEKNWLDFIENRWKDKIPSTIDDFCILGDYSDESEIVGRIEQEDKLNPVGFQRVVR